MSHAARVSGLYLLLINVYPLCITSSAYYEYGLYLHNWYRKRHGAPPLKLANWMNDSGDNYCLKLARNGGMLIHSTGLGYGENLWGGPQSEVTLQQCGVSWVGGTIIVAGCYKVFPNIAGHFGANVLRYRDVLEEPDPVEVKKPEVQPVSSPDTQVDNEKGKGEPSLPNSGEYKWVATQNGGSMPKNMIWAGKDGQHDIYVSRANHSNGVIPGKLLVGYGTFVAYGGSEHGKGSYEVLTGEASTFSWVHCGTAAAAIPKNAIVGGKDPNGDIYYIGRATVKNAVAAGRVHPSSGRLYVSYGGQEFCFEKDFDILVSNSPQTLDKDTQNPELGVSQKDDEVDESEGTGDPDENATVDEESSLEMQTAFTEVADSDGTIGWYELKDLLAADSEFGDKVAWDKVLCRMLIKTATERGEGISERIKFLTFENLVKGLDQAIGNFTKADKDGDSLIRSKLGTHFQAGETFRMQMWRDL